MIVRILLGLCIFLPVQAAELPPLEDMMTEKELRETGLYKLEADERRRFHGWLEIFIERDAEFFQRRHREELAEQKYNQPPMTGERAFAGGQESEDERDGDGAIKSNILGEFTGWQGRTKFELANGQVWEHRRKWDVFRHRPITDPEVIIKKNFLGFFTMEIPAAKVKLPVKRIR